MATKESEVENSEKLIPKEERPKEEESKIEKSDLQNEPKTYFNCGCFQISVGIIFTYIYLDDFLHNLPNSTTSTKKESYRKIIKR